MLFKTKLLQQPLGPGQGRAGQVTGDQLDFRNTKPERKTHGQIHLRQIASNYWKAAQDVPPKRLERAQFPRNVERQKEMDPHKFRVTPVQDGH